MLFFLGAYHGMNPGMGWLFAVAMAMQRQSPRAVWQSLLPIAAGHALAIAIIVAGAALLGAMLPANYIRIFVACALLAFGTYRLIRQEHPGWGGMRAGFRDLTIWSFLMASAHGAGFMLLPFILRGLTHSHHDGHADTQIIHGTWTAVWAVVSHTLGYLITTGTLAFVAYKWVGLSLLGRAWINLDLVWGTALILTAVAALVW